MIMDGGFSMPFVKGLLEVVWSIQLWITARLEQQQPSRQGGVSPKTTGRGRGHQFFLLMESWMLMDF